MGTVRILWERIYVIEMILLCLLLNKYAYSITFISKLFKLKMYNIVESSVAKVSKKSVGKKRW